MAKLVSYKVSWDFDTHKGQIQLRVASGSKNPQTALVTYTVQPESAAEMHMLVDILRNEMPLEYDSSGKVLRSGAWETVGEGEA